MTSRVFSEKNPVAWLESRPMNWLGFEKRLFWSAGAAIVTNKDFIDFKTDCFGFSGSVSNSVVLNEKKELLQSVAKSKNGW